MVPLAVSRLDRPVAFTALVDAPVVSRGQEQLYSELTGEEGGHATDLSQPAIIERVRDAGPSDFDPEPLLSEQPFPSLWLYGGQDQSQPTTLDLEVLTRLSASNNGVKTIVFPEADHGLLDIPPSDPRRAAHLRALDPTHGRATETTAIVHCPTLKRPSLRRGWVC